MALKQFELQAQIDSLTQILQKGKEDFGTLQRECDQSKSHFEMGKTQNLQLQQQIVELRSKAEAEVAALSSKVIELTQLNE